MDGVIEQYLRLAEIAERHLEILDIDRYDLESELRSERKRHRGDLAYILGVTDGMLANENTEEKNETD